MLSLACVAGAQSLSVSPTSANLNALLGSNSPVSQTINVTPSSGSFAYMVYNANPGNSWLSVAPSCTSSSCPTQASISNLSAPGSFAIVVNPTNLSSGTYNGQVIVVGGTSNITINVQFVVGTIGLANGTQLPVTLTYVQNSNSFPQGVNLSLVGTGSTQYTTSVPSNSNCSWLLIPASGAGTVAVNVNNAAVVGLTPNTYTCTFSVIPTNSTNTALSIPVVLNVTTSPNVTVSPSTVALNYQNNTTAYPSQTLTISSTGTQSIGYTLSSPQTTDSGYTGPVWFTISKSSGTIAPPGESDTVTVSYTPTSLSPGTYHGQVILTASNIQQTIPVTLLVSNSPLLNVSPASVTFTSELNGSSPAPVTVEVTQTSGGAPVIGVTPSTTSGGNWLFASIGASITTATSQCPAPPCTPVTISVNTSSLALGQYKGTVTINGSNTANNPQVAVTLNVANDPLIQTNMSTSQPLIFAFQTGTSATSVPAQTVTVSSTTGAQLNYTATAANTTASGCTNWLSLSSGSTSGTTNGNFTVSASPSGVAAATSGPACTGTITIVATNPATGNSAPNSPYVIPVNFFVSSNALMVLTPDTAPAFTAQVGIASSVTSQNCATNATANCTLSLSSTSATDPITVRVDTTTTDGTNWLFALPTSGSIPINGSISLNIGLAFVPATPGSYSGTVKITGTTQSSSAILDSPLIIPVTLQVTAGAPTANPSQLTFTQTLGGATPPAQTINIGSSTGQAISFTAGATTTSSTSWLSVTPNSGTTPATVSVSVNAANLTASTTPYQGSITISAAGSSSTVTVPVSFTVNAGTVAATPTTVSLTGAQGSTTAVTQTVSVTGTPGVINFTTSASTTSGGNWLTATPASGSTPGTVTVSATVGSLSTGTYNGSVVITAAGATGSPITIPVTLTVVTSQTLTVTPTTLSFTAAAGQSSPAGQTVSLSSSGSGTSFSAAATTASGGNWLSVSPASGVTPAQLTINVATQSLAVGNYTGTVTINSPNAATPATVSVTLTVANIPTPVVTALKNAASYAVGGVAPGENIVIGGTGIGPATLTGLVVTSSGNVATTVANTQILFDNIPAPIIYVSATQSSVMVPYEIAGRATTNLTVVYQGVASAPVTYNVLTAQPGVYTQNASGTGPGSILNQNYSVNGPSSPAASGSVIAVYMTGEGATTPSSPTGGVAPINGTGLNKPNLPVTATIGGVPATVNYYGSAPSIVYGVMQVNITVPSGLSNGAQPIQISVGNLVTQTGVTVTIQNSTSAEPE